MIIHLRDAMRQLALPVAAAVLGLGAGATASAQSQPADARWEAWIGCWQPAAVASASGTSFVCVAPTSNASTVQIATLEKGVVVSRDTIDASGAQHVINKQGCAGWERANWSSDARRVFLRSEVTCTGGLKRVGSGLLAISPTGEWLDVQGVTAGGNGGVRAAHYQDASESSAPLPAEFANLNAGNQLATNTARRAAGAALTVSDIVEATQALDTAVVQAWIIERGTRFNLSANELVSLADAGVPGSVTDAMVGVSYPDHFALERRATGPLSAGSMLFSPGDSARLASQYLRDRCTGSAFNSLWYTPGYADPCAFAYGYGSSAFRYGYGYGYGSGFSPYGIYQPYGYGGSGYYYVPVVVVKGDQQQHGTVVKGRGYTSGSSGSDGSTRGSWGPSTPAASTSTTSSSSGSSASSGSSSSGSSGDGGRTAHPRPPI